MFRFVAGDRGIRHQRAIRSLHQEPMFRVRTRDHHLPCRPGPQRPVAHAKAPPMPEDVDAIVIVEDDDSSRRAYERVLKAAGFQAKVFDSAETLLEGGAAADAACLVFDVRLPGLSGFELRRELVRTGSTRAPVIFITAHDEPAVRAQAQAFGAVAYLPKPFAGRALVDAVTRALAEREIP